MAARVMRFSKQITVPAQCLRPQHILDLIIVQLDADTLQVESQLLQAFKHESASLAPTNF